VPFVPGPLRRIYASLPPAYWTIWLGTLVNRVGGFVVPFLALYITRQRHESEAAAGVVVALYGAGNIIASLVGGTLADRVGRRATMLISLFGGSLAMLAIGFARSLPELGAATFFMGWVAEMYRPAVSAMIADVVPPEDRGRAFAYLYWVINLGYAIAPALAGLIANYSYLAIFLIDASTTFVFGAVVLLRVPETRPAEAAAAAQRGDGPGLVHVLRDRTFMIFVLLSVGTATVMLQNNVALPIDMARHGISSSAYGALVSINGWMIVFLQPFITRALAHRSRTRVLALSSLCMGVGFGLYGLGSYAGYAIAIAVWTVGEIANLPTTSLVTAELAPAELRGRYQGVANLSWSVAALISPLIGGVFMRGPGGLALWLSCFALMVVVTVGHVALGPARKRREI
jgi:MFS family permease